MATQLQTFPYTKAQKCLLKLHIFTAIHTSQFSYIVYWYRWKYCILVHIYIFHSITL